MEKFRLATTIYTGADSLDALNQLTWKRVLVITDPFWSGGGITQVMHRLSGQVQVFDGVTGEPDLAMCAQGVAAFQSFQPEGMVALGGGSVLDCAKAIRRYALPEGAHIPLWVIPTTAGTGSEVTCFSVLKTGEGKIPLVEEGLLPEAAILAPVLLDTLPPGAVADTGMDALSHGVECFVSTGANPFSDALALEGIRLLWNGLPEGMEGKPGARGGLLTAACLTGAAFNSASLGICHSLSHALGGRFHLPHGRLNGVLLPTVVGFNAGLDVGLTPAAQRYAQLAGYLGLTDGRGRAGVFAFLRGLERLRQRLNLPGTLTEAGIPEAALRESLTELSQAALRDVCTASNPRPVTAGELGRLLEEAL